MSVSRDTKGRTFFAHPRGLANLFGVEMWERFSFYGMQGILTIYLYLAASEGGLGLREATATSIVGAYDGSSTCRPSPVPGPPTDCSDRNACCSTARF